MNHQLPVHLFTSIKTSTITLDDFELFFVRQINLSGRKFRFKSRQKIVDKKLKKDLIISLDGKTIKGYHEYIKIKISTVSAFLTYQ